MIEAVLLDIDGTLIDNNLLHALAWERVGKQVDANLIIHKVGMGGDQLALSVLGAGAGEAIEQARRFHEEEYSEKGLIDHSEPLPGAVDLLRALWQRGVRVALASSAKKQEVERYLKQLGGRQAVDAIVMSEDVSSTKPAGDIFATPWTSWASQPTRWWLAIRSMMWLQPASLIFPALACVRAAWRRSC